MRVIVIIGLVIIAGFFSFGENGASMREDPQSRRAHYCSEQGRTSAYTMAQTFVERRLRAPASAEFPWMTGEGVRVIHRSGCDFTVHGYVDAQNGFGALIRTRFVADLTYSPDADEWRAREILLLE